MLRAAVALLVLAALPAFAAWPEKPIKVFIGYAPGGSTDVVARLLSPKLSEKLGQPIVIENKPGGAGDFAAEMMLQAPADGYTLLMTTVAVHAINPGLYKTQKFHPINDFTPIALVCSYPMIMIGSPQTTFKTLGGAEGARRRRRRPSIRPPASAPRPPRGRAAGARARRQHHPRALQGRLALGARDHVGRSAGQFRHAAGGGAADPRRQGARHRPRVEGAQPRGARCADDGASWASPISTSARGAAWSARKACPPMSCRRSTPRSAAVVNDPVIRQRLLDEGAEIRLMSPAEFGTFMRAENSRWVKVVKDAESRRNRGGRRAARRPRAGRPPGLIPFPTPSSPASRFRGDRPRW